LRTIGLGFVVACGLSFGAGTAAAQVDAEESAPKAPDSVAAPAAATEPQQPEGDSPLAKANEPAPDAIVAPKPLPIEAPQLEWNPEWARVGTANYLLVGLGAAASVGTAIIRPSSSHNLAKPILFDEAARKALRLPNLNARYTARDISDVLLSLEVTWPFAIDSLVVASGVRRSPDVAWEMAVIDAEAIALTAAVHQATAMLVSRPRPYTASCGTTLSPDLNDCVRNGRYKSFFSGHAALSFTGASLVCAHRARFELFGPKADVVTCVTAYAAAAAVATLRVVGDVHNASDVIAGAIVGTAIGLGIPALHYRSWHDRPRGAKVGRDYEVTVYPTGYGVGMAVVY
jgi:membrane-associated phospholipid phosphatase